MAQAVSELIQLELPVRDYGELNEIAARLEDASAEEILRWAFEEFGDRVTIATGLGAEGVALVDLATRINARPQVFFLDTSFLFPETYELRRKLEDRYRIEIRAFQSELSPEAQELAFGPKLWTVDPDLCCRLRKLEPLREALKDSLAWMTAIRRDQTEARAVARTVEWDYQWKLVKINPLARWSKADVWNYIRKNDVPYNSLHDSGYPSIGCTHCTRAIYAGEDERAGRWSGLAKTECGLHGRTSPEKK